MKAKRRGVLKFQQKSSRPPLTREQCGYWLDHLPKILKVGTEFEINLPEPTENLRRKDNSQCIHAANPCVTDCVNLETCLVERHPTFCQTRHSGKFLDKEFHCPAKDDADTKTCKTCPAWALLCRGLNCAMHTPFCTICPSFTRAGQKVIEKSDIRQDAEFVRQEIKQILDPTENLGYVGRGALEVKKDNSLQHNGGIEVPTVGRRIHWNSFYNMCKNIIDPIVARGGYVNERCGQHFHILAGYFNKNVNQKISDLEEPLPEIVLANLHQLHRRYELAMFWMMSTGDDLNSLTRWARFRQSIYRFSALRNKMSQVQSDLAQNIVCMGGTPQNGKYASMAYHFCEFTPQGDASIFHIENRIADGCLSPAVVTAWAMLTYALVLKAVRLSQYGIMEVGDQDFVSETKQAQPHLLDGEKRSWDGSRLANTSGLSPHIPFLRDLSREMVQLLKSELGNLGPSFNILMELADKPVSIRRVEGDSWDKIEKDLYGSYALEEVDTYPSKEAIQELIDLACVVECSNLDTWIEEVSANLGKNPETVAISVHNLLASGRYRWSDAIGSLITK